MKQYHDHHFELMQKLDTQQIPHPLTVRWMKARFGVERFVDLSERQCRALIKSLKGGRVDAQELVEKEAGKEV